MNTMTSRLPAASCLMAVGALVLALASWTVRTEVRNPALALTGLAMTIASLVSAIVGIIAFRHGPRRLALTAWIGLLLCGLPLTFWGLMLWIILSIKAGHPF